MMDDIGDLNAQVLGRKSRFEDSSLEIGARLCAKLYEKGYAITHASPEFGYDLPEPPIRGGCRPDFVAASADAETAYAIAVSKAVLVDPEIASRLNALSDRYDTDTLRPIKLFIGIADNAKMVESLKAKIRDSVIHLRQNHVIIIRLV